MKDRQQGEARRPPDRPGLSGQATDVPGAPRQPPTRFAMWRLRSRWCMPLDWLVGIAGLTLTLLSCTDSVVSWWGYTVLVYPATLEHVAAVLLLPSWAWVLVSSVMLGGLPRRRKRPTRSALMQAWRPLKGSWKRILRLLAGIGLVVVAVVVTGFAVGAAKGSLRVLPGGVHQVSTLDLNSANWTTVSRAEYGRWAARFVREDAAFGFFGVVMVGFSLLVHNLRRAQAHGA